MYMVWFFENNNPKIKGIFENEEFARKVCDIGDCYHPIELNRIYKEEVNITDIAQYKYPDGQFKEYNL